MYIRAKLKVNIRNKQIFALLTGCEEFEIPRPHTWEQIGADVEILNKISRRIDGTYETIVRLSAGSVIITDLKNLFWPSEKHLRAIKENFFRNFGSFESKVILTHFRDGYAPEASWKLDVAIGALNEITNPLNHALRETAEFGVYNQDGWIKFRLGKSFKDQKDLQKILFDSQGKSWKSIGQMNPIENKIALIDFLPLPQYDMLGEEKLIISIGRETGTAELIYPLYLKLPKGMWKIKYCDLNLVGEGKEIAFQRKERIILKPKSGPPITCAWGENGIHPDHEVILLRKEGAGYYASQKVLDVLRALRWL